MQKVVILALEMAILSTLLLPILLLKSTLLVKIYFRAQGSLAIAASCLWMAFFNFISHCYKCCGYDLPDWTGSQALKTGSAVIEALYFRVDIARYFIMCQAVSASGCQNFWVDEKDAASECLRCGWIKWLSNVHIYKAFKKRFKWWDTKRSLCNTKKLLKMV